MESSNYSSMRKRNPDKEEDIFNENKKFWRLTEKTIAKKENKGKMAIIIVAIRMEKKGKENTRRKFKN